MTSDAFPISAERTPLLASAQDSQVTRPETRRKSAAWSEAGHIVRMAIPLVLLSVLRYWTMGITVLTIGRLGVTELAAASLGFLHFSVVALSIIHGMNAALDTLANQAAGSDTPHLASLYAMRQFVVILTLLPAMFVLMWFGTSIIAAFSPHVDKDMLRLAQLYIRIMFFCIPAYAGSDCIRRFCQSLGRVNGLALAYAISMPVSVGLNVLLVHGPPRWRLGFIGAPIAVVIAYNVMFLVMLAYAIMTTPKSAWCGFSRAIFQDLGLNYSLGFAGAVALCSEWWVFELLGASAMYLGMIPQAVTAIFVSLISAAFPVTSAVCTASATRVGNLLGGGQAERAKTAAKVAQRLAVSVASCAALTVVLSSNRLGGWYTNDPAILATMKSCIFVPALAIIGDGVQNINAGVLRGAGAPYVAARVNVIAFWGIGVWITLDLGLMFQTIPALWAGYLLTLGGAQLVIMYRIHTIDWNRQVEVCKARLGASSRREEDVTA